MIDGDLEIVQVASAGTVTVATSGVVPFGVTKGSPTRRSRALTHPLP
jgi:hypothetical protein